jgi:mRNA-degrading endonuclease RelE of RelBE toxin-antitoxin system
MDKIEKLFRRIPKRDRLRIQEILLRIKNRDYKDLKRQKLKGYENIYRIRTGNYRIIYFDDGEEIILKAVKKRDEATYHEF